MIYNLNQHLHGEYKSYHSPFLCDFGIFFQPNSLTGSVGGEIALGFGTVGLEPPVGSPTFFLPGFTLYEHGSLNVPIEHHPTIRYMVYNGYYKVRSNIPKMGQLPTPDEC